MITDMMLSLDLEGHVSPENREKVYNKLREAHWAKIPFLTTTWRTSFQNPVTEEFALQTAKADVKAAAAAGQVLKYHAAVMTGTKKPSEFSS